MRIDIVSIFPEYLAPLNLSLVGKAQERGLVSITVHDLRDATTDIRRTVDGPPAGGGAGMVMSPEPWGKTLDAIAAHGTTGPDGPADSQDRATSEAPGNSQEAATSDGSASFEEAASSDGPGKPQRLADRQKPVLLVPSPAGTVFSQQLAHDLATEPHIVFACGRYEGIDDRVMHDAAHRYRVVPISLGDYVLNGGEVAALAVVEAVARLIPGMVGNPESLVEESHSDGLLEYPVYTNPAEWRGLTVPEVLRSGHHAHIAAWRRGQSELRTAQRRPDLLPAQCDDSNVTLRQAIPADHGQLATLTKAAAESADQLTWLRGELTAATETLPQQGNPATGQGSTSPAAVGLDSAPTPAAITVAVRGDRVIGWAAWQTPADPSTSSTTSSGAESDDTESDGAALDGAESDGAASQDVGGQGVGSDGVGHSGGSPVARCTAIVVAPDVHREGVGMALLRHGVAIADKAGRQVQIQVPQSEKKLLKAFAKQGSRRLSGAAQGFVVLSEPRKLLR